MRRGYEALNLRDAETIRELLAPDVVLATTVETFRGPDGVLEWLRRADEVFDGYRLVVEDYEIVDGRLIAFTHQTARGRGSGMVIDHRIAHLWEVRDGKVATVRAFIDPDEARAAARG